MKYSLKAALPITLICVLLYHSAISLDCSLQYEMYSIFFSSNKNVILNINSGVRSYGCINETKLLCETCYYWIFV